MDGQDALSGMGINEPTAAGGVWGRVADGLERAAPLVAVLFIGLFVVVAGLRVGYPYELEWMEGGSLGHVRRVLAGEPLYVAPSLDFTPYIYTPLYYWVSAGAAALLGEGFAALRLVSTLSTLGCLCVLVLLVHRETGSGRLGLLAAGLFAATFMTAGAWFDLGRVDSLFLLLLLAGVYRARWARGTAGLAGAGLLFGLAFLTKQTALVITLPLALWALLAHRGPARVALVASFALVAGGSTLALDALSDGWFSFYAFTLPRHHNTLPELVVLFWTADVLRPLGLAALATAAFLAQARRDQRAFYGLLLVGLVGASYASRIHAGGYVNVLLPVYAGLAVGAALGVGALQPRASQLGARPRAFLSFAVLVQFAALFESPIGQVPTAADRAAGDRLVEALREVPGDVLVLSHPHLAWRAGKPPHAQRMALYDVRRGTSAGWEVLEAEVASAIRSRRYEAVILDVEWAWRPEGFETHYCPAGPVFEDPDVFWPVTGEPMRPTELYHLCEPGDE